MSKQTPRISAFDPARLGAVLALLLAVPFVPQAEAQGNPNLPTLDCQVTIGPFPEGLQGLTPYGDQGSRSGLANLVAAVDHETGTLSYTYGLRPDGWAM